MADTPYSSVDSTDLAKDRTKWWAVVSTVMNTFLPQIPRRIS